MGKDALEYISVDTRKCSEHGRKSIHHAKMNEKSEDETMRDMINSMHNQMKFIMEGLSQVITAVSNSSQVQNQERTQSYVADRIKC